MITFYKKDYPRPQLVRNNWTNLNGEWDFAFDDENIGMKEEWYLGFPTEKKINVPFVYETVMSGIHDESQHKYIWYRRSFELTTRDMDKQRVHLHFEGSDFITRVWLNGRYIGEHTGGYSRFTFDVTDAAQVGKNKLIVRVEDANSESQPRGKQRWVKDNFGCWYVQTTGIWKTVWLETVNPSHIDSVKITPCLESRSVDLDVVLAGICPKEPHTLRAIVTFNGQFVNQAEVIANKDMVSLHIPVYSTDVEPFGVATWSPSNPNLYEIKLELLQDPASVDEVQSYFGLREIRIESGQVLLNGHPIYQRLILDQGYWKDSGITPPSEDALVEDIDKIMALGYNGLRKHQKTEDERFLFWCDVKGLLVWSEYAANYVYNDTAITYMTREWMDIVRQNYNHPCIITWTALNESWGVPEIATSKVQQNYAQAIYFITKSYDTMRPVIVNDGWEHTISDILTLHDYVENGSEFIARYKDNFDGITNNQVFFNKNKLAFARGFKYLGQPIIISEYGGIAFSNEKEGWGYGHKVKDEAEFLRRFDDITTAIKSVPYICGFCYTQVTDVQQEINGLMDIGRNYKVDCEKIREVNVRARGVMGDY